MGLTEKTGRRGGPPGPREAAARWFLRTAAATCMPAPGTAGSKPVASRSEAPRSCQGSLGSAGEWHTGQRRLPRCGAAATSDELLYLQYCPGCVSVPAAQGAAVALLLSRWLFSSADSRSQPRNGQGPPLSLVVRLKLWLEFKGGGFQRIVIYQRSIKINMILL